MRGAEAPSAKRCRRSVALDWQRADAFALTLDSVSAPSSRHGLPETDAAPDTTPSPVERRPYSAVSRHTQEAIRRACADLVNQIDSSESGPKKATMIDENRYRRSPPPVPRRKWGPFSMKVRQLFRGGCFDTPWPDLRPIGSWRKFLCAQHCRHSFVRRCRASDAARAVEGGQEDERIFARGSGLYW